MYVNTTWQEVSTQGYLWSSLISTRTPSPTPTPLTPSATGGKIRILDFAWLGFYWTPFPIQNSVFFFLFINQFFPIVHNTIQFGRI